MDGDARLGSSCKYLCQDPTALLLSLMLSQAGQVHDLDFHGMSHYHCICGTGGVCSPGRCPEGQFTSVDRVRLSKILHGQSCGLEHYPRKDPYDRFTPHAMLTMMTPLDVHIPI